MPYIFLLFVLIPIIEIALLIQVGSVIGLLPTIGIVILTAVIGTAMLRQQGLATLQAAQQRMQSGQMPAQQIGEGLLLVFGGALLLTPGFATDAFGFLCLFPVTRRWMAKKIGAKTMSNAQIFTPNGQSPYHPSDSADRPTSGQNRGSPSNSKGGDVIDGDYQRLD
ncbi:MAG: FxsA family protein [Granulosicoccaceae bacterium]